MDYKYAKLRGRIVEKYGSQKKFSEVIGLSTTSISLKMQGWVGFSQKDIQRWSEALDIEPEEYQEYFFT